VIIRWQRVIGSAEIVVDWRAGIEQHRTIYVVEPHRTIYVAEHGIDGPYLRRVVGETIGESDYVNLLNDVNAFEAHASWYAAARPMYYAGALAESGVAP